MYVVVIYLLKRSVELLNFEFLQSTPTKEKAKSENPTQSDLLPVPEGPSRLPIIGSAKQAFLTQGGAHNNAIITNK